MSKIAPPDLTNAWLAEKVFGNTLNELAEIITVVVGEGEVMQLQREPDFLHNPADALRFVDYFIEQHQVEIYLTMTQTWVQCVIRYSWCCGEAPTLALAICRAAQAWVLREEAEHGTT